MKIEQSQFFTIERAIIELEERKEVHVLRKRENELSLSEITNRIRASAGGLPPSEYTALCRKQNEIKKSIYSIESELSKINIDLRKKHLLRDEIKNDNIEYSNDTVVKTLTEMRDEYNKFASDLTRVSSMRAMAAEFAGKIEVVIGTIQYK